jgi:predicted 2-oxoglutarate/Fe(II)-dependent dioxygenase YbiX
MPLTMGVPAPRFKTRTKGLERFDFGNVGGQHVVVAFLPKGAAEVEEALRLLQSQLPLFRQGRHRAFAVIEDADLLARTPEEDALILLPDEQREIARRFRQVGADGAMLGGWLVLDPQLRTLGAAPLADGPQVMANLKRLPAPDDHAGVPLFAPVLVIPRVFTRDLCQRLVAYYKDKGGLPSGSMVEIGGKTVEVLGQHKKRSDVYVNEEPLQAEIRNSLSTRLLPEIERAFQFKVTRMERYLIACYDAVSGGYFHKHRDNTTPGTAHRKFACSINLNAEEFSGGDLRFPEFGSRTYRPPTGGAVVFSCSLLHEATSVTEGERYAFLPFLYDEAGAEIREQNLKSVELRSESERLAFAAGE